jgi:SAM-dependent methyltransferase
MHGMQLAPAQALRGTKMGGRFELPAAKHSRSVGLTALDVKKGKGTAPNNPKKKGREAYLAAKKALEAQRAASPQDCASADAQPRPGEDDTWTMEEAWEDHTAVLARVMTEAAPDFAAGPAVVEVALGAPEKWWSEVVIPRLTRIAEAAYNGVAPTNEQLRVIDVGTGTGTMLPHLTAAQPAGVDCKVVGVDLCEAMLDIVEERFPDVPLLTADFSAITPQDLHAVLCPEDAEEKRESPAEMAASGNGKVDLVVMNAVYSLMLDETDTLEAAARMLRRGGRVVISHPLGREFVGGLQKQVPGGNSPTQASSFCWL